MPKPERAPGGQRERPRGANPLRVQPPGDQRGDRERERDREQRVAAVEHRRVDHHPRVAQQRVQADALADDHARACANGDSANTSSDAKNAPKPSRTACAYGASTRSRWRVMNRISARPRAEQEQPQQQRALLRGPHRGQAVEERRRRRGLCEATTANSKSLSARTRSRAARRRPRSRRPSRTRRVGRSRRTRGGARVRRTATPRPRRGRSRERRSGSLGPRGARQVCVWSAVNFDGHFVTSVPFWPT